MQFDDDSLFRMIDAGVGHIERMRLVACGSFASLQALGPRCDKSGRV